MKTRREWALMIVGFFLLLGITPGPVQAKLDYPTKPIEMIVAYPQGADKTSTCGF